MFYKIARHRPANQAAQHQAKGGAGHRHFGGILEAIALNKQLTPGRTGAVPTGKGNRAGQQTHQRIQPQQGSHTDTDGVLHHQQPDHHN
ncbi:hypothetical protein D3C76_1441280 [compost metagenome]